jgi:hypothetical protein
LPHRIVHHGFVKFVGVFLVTLLGIAAAMCGLWMAFLAFAAYRMGFAADSFAAALFFAVTTVGVGSAIFAGWLVLRLNRWYAK